MNIIHNGKDYEVIRHVPDDFVSMTTAFRERSAFSVDIIQVMHYHRLNKQDVTELTYSIEDMKKIIARYEYAQDVARIEAQEALNAELEQAVGSPAA